MIFISFIALALVVLVLAGRAFQALPEYERAVIYTLGRYARTEGPGLVLVKPVVEVMVRVDLREQALDVPCGDVSTKDNRPCGFDATVRFRVVTPAQAVNAVPDYKRAVADLSRKTIAEALGKVDLSDIRAVSTRDLREKLNAQTGAWGIEVGDVTLAAAKPVPTGETG